MALTDRLKGRYNEDYLLETNANRRDTYDAWHSRITENDEYIKGNFPVVQPDGSTATKKPIVGNLVDQMPRDLARLANEIEPTYRAPAFGESKDHLENAKVRGVITEGYFTKNRFELHRPQLVMDLAVAGAAFEVCWTDSKLDVPRMTRIDPRACFPDFYNGELLDLLVVTNMKVRQADRMWPGLNLGKKYALAKQTETGASEYVEIWDLWAGDICLKAVALMNDAKQVIEAGLQIIDSWEPRLKDGQPPVGFAQVPSPDGSLRGLLDQIGAGLVAKNQIAEFILNYAEQMVYAPFEYKGIINPSDPPGPNTEYAHDPNSTTETFMRRVEPASFNGQLNGFLQFMDDEQRAQIAFPAARQGDVSQSIVSGAGIQGMQGQYTSLARDVQRMLSDIQEQVGCIAQELDCHYKDFVKPMHRSLGRKRTYKPSSDIQERYGITVNYGAGSGLDRLNTDVRLIQFYGSGLISMETVLENLDFIADSTTEIDKRQREEVMRIVLQRWAGDPNTAIDFMILISQLQDDEGLSFREALQRASEEMAPQIPQAGQAGLMGQPAQTAGGTPAAAPTEVAAGEVPSEPIVQPSFTPTAQTQAFVNQPE